MNNAAILHSQRMIAEAHSDAVLLRHKRAARSVALDAASIYGCRPEAVFRGSDHRAETVLARRHVIHELTRRGWTQSRIAHAIGVDRTTVLYALRQPLPGRPVVADNSPIPCPDESGIWAI